MGWVRLDQIRMVMGWSTFWIWCLLLNSSANSVVRLRHTEYAYYFNADGYGTRCVPTTFIELGFALTAQPNLRIINSWTQ